MVRLALAEGKPGKVTAHVAVAEHGRPPEKKLMIGIKVDGKAVGGTVMTDEGGRASIELTLKPGPHKILADVVGGADYVIENIEIGDIPKKTTGGFGKFMMVAFWASVLIFGGGLLLKLTYLIVFLGIPVLVTIKGARNREERVRRLKEKFWNDNNWVFKVTLAMLIVSVFAAYFNPLIPQNAIVGFLGKIANFVARRLGYSNIYHVVTGRHEFWRFLNRTFFGRSFTYGWRVTAIAFLGWTLLSILISFSDEVLGWIFHLLKKQGEGKGLFAGFARIMVSDFVAGKIWHRLGIDV